jgi:ketosteroid isomerase-like protein
MAKNPTDTREEEIVESYFGYVRELRNGVEGAVERLMSLWDDDGVFEFAGTPPVAGTFVGANAIAALYKNRYHSSGMPLRLEGSGTAEDVELGIVDTEVTRSRRRENKIIVAWTTTIGTADQRGFQVAGSHVFSFRNDKIATLRVVVSPRPETHEELRLEELSVEDIGRLSLAAWMVV